jgi:hypothetical protein
MKFNDTKFSKEHRFSIGIEEESKKFYISFPAFNGMAEYEEYFEISKEEYDHFILDENMAKPFVLRCKQRKEDDRLIYQPSVKRGTPC